MKKRLNCTSRWSVWILNTTPHDTRSVAALGVLTATHGNTDELGSTIIPFLPNPS